VSPVAVIGVALIVGVGFGAPHLIGVRVVNDPPGYTPLVVTDVSFVTIDETFVYGARVREVMDGRWFVTDPLTWEHKPAWPYWIPPEQWLLGAMARLLGGVPAVYVVADFVFPPFVFVVTAGLVAALTGSWLLGSAGALLLLARGLHHSLAMCVELGRAAMGGDTPAPASIVRPLEFSRLFAPELTFVPFAGALWALALALQRTSVTWAAVAGVALAVVIPSYVYYWTVVAAATAVLLAASVLRRRAVEARLFALVLCTGALLAAPYFASSALAMMQTGRGEGAARFAVERGRYVSWPPPKDAILMTLAGLLAWRLRSRCLLVVFAVWVGYMLCRNVQLVTSFTLHAVHWGYRVGYIWQTITLIALLATVPRLLAERWPRAEVAARRMLTAGAIAVIVVALVAILGYQAAFARNTAPAFALPDGYREAFAWVNRSTPPDSVIATPSFETNMLLPVYTHANVFLPNHHSLAPTAEIVERLLLVYKVFGVPAPYLAESLGDDTVRAGAMIANRGRFDRRRPELLEQAARWYVFHLARPSDALVADLVARYERLTVPPAQPFGRFRADYVWMSAAEATKGRFETSEWPGMVVVYRAGGVTIARTRADAKEPR